MVKENTEENPPPEMTSETGRERADTQIGVPAEIEVEEMELPEQRCSTMGDQEDPEGIARRLNVWWGLR